MFNTAFIISLFFSYYLLKREKPILVNLEERQNNEKDNY